MLPAPAAARSLRLSTKSRGKSITKRSRVDLNPQAIIVNPITNKIYVAAANGTNLILQAFNPNGDVRVIDGTTDTPTAAVIEVGRNPFALALNPVTNRIYVANDGNGLNATVSVVIDGSSDLPLVELLR